MVLVIVDFLVFDVKSLGVRYYMLQTG